MSSDAPSAPTRIIEIKRTLDHREKRFECTVLHRAGNHLVVLFIAPDAMNVHGVVLPAGTVTFGHFWSDRPYNVYHWLDRNAGSTIGQYVNLSSDTDFSNGTLDWLDLIVDILILPGQSPVILDEDEIPSDIASDVRGRIENARDTVLANLASLRSELDQHRAALWPRVRAGLGNVP